MKPSSSRINERLKSNVSYPKLGTLMIYIFKPLQKVKILDVAGIAAVIEGIMMPNACVQSPDLRGHKYIDKAVLANIEN
jgi:hypothetical protein